MVTSRPSRIQVIPSAAITSQCQRAHGSRSILVGMRLSTASCVAEAPLLTLPPLCPDEEIGSPTLATASQRAACIPRNGHLILAVLPGWPGCLLGVACR